MSLRLPIGEIVATHQGGLHRVAAEAAGAALWFESADAPLCASPEAYGSAMLVAALHAGSQLELGQAACREWLSNIERLLPILQEWWGYPALVPLAPCLDKAAAAPGAQTALCFSGGVDSFYSLLRGEHRPQWLVFVSGYDITLHDAARMAACESTLRVIAAECGARPVVVRTNLREHHVFAEAPWVRTHGGALAAIGHVLAGPVGQLIISSTYQYDHSYPWGSHWRTDPLWSSRLLRIIHQGASLWRHQKLWAIADEELVRRHLRVCWENRVPAGNCSRCDKCVITMLELEMRGRLRNFAVFEHPWSLAGRIDALPRTAYQRTYDVLLQQGLSYLVKRAVKRLLRRTGQPLR
jgi:hypothetical protein